MVKSHSVLHYTLVLGREPGILEGAERKNSLCSEVSLELLEYFDRYLIELESTVYSNIENIRSIIFSDIFKGHVSCLLIACFFLLKLK